MRSQYQQERQAADRQCGRYATVNPCQGGCGKSAGVHYYSHPDTDGGNGPETDIGDALLTLCRKCCILLETLPGPEAVKVARERESRRAK